MYKLFFPDLLMDTQLHKDDSLQQLFQIRIKKCDCTVYINVGLVQVSKKKGKCKTLTYCTVPHVFTAQLE